MYQSSQGQFLVYSVLPTDYGVALSQTGDKRQGWPKTEPVVWHFPKPLSMTPEYWSRSWLAPEHGGRRGVVNAGAVCQETVHYGQGIVMATFSQSMSEPETMSKGDSDSQKIVPESND